ncbi:MAG: pirin-like C-terminal cupin domain-containing protein, partial [Methylocella sp.]
PAGWTTAMLVLKGQVRLASGETAGGAELAVFEREDETFAAAALEDATLLFLNGQPIEEPIVGQGPFVMNTRAEIDQAMDDYRSGRMGRLAAQG